MTTKSLIVRVVLAADWPAAFRIVSLTASAKAAAGQGLDAGGVALGMGDLPPWPQRRNLCLSLARRYADEPGDDELAAAWFTLGADPGGAGWRTAEGHKNYTPVLVALARAILANPALLDDEAFAAAVDGWRFLERAGSDGEDDLIVAARLYGAMAKIDKPRLLSWARTWSQVAP
jgi:hypothetical protein